MLISKVFNGRMMEFMPASAFATAIVFFLLGNIDALSDTSSSIDLKTKTSMRYSLFG